jgi:hypothetical protein
LMVDMASSEVFLVAISRLGFGQRSPPRAAIGFQDGFVATSATQYVSLRDCRYRRRLIHPSDCELEKQTR